MSAVVASPPAAIDRSVLDRSLFWALAYTGGVKWLAQAFAWASTLVVARLLTPEDYGLVSMATVYIGMITLVNEFGLGTAVITRRDLSNHALAQLNSLAVMVGLAALAVSCAAAEPLARFFEAPALRWVVIIMSLGFVMSAFQTVPGAILQKELRFKWLAFLEGWQAAIIGASMVLLAFLGFRYWTLVLGNLLGTAFTVAMVLSKRSHGFAWPRLRELGAALALSRHVALGRLAWYAQTNADFVVAGRVLGQAALGAYSIGWTLASVPVDKISAVVARVTPAFFSAVQTDLAAVRRYLLLLTEALALVTIPLALGVALAADDIVLLLLGEKWRAVIGPLRLLAVLASLRPIVSLLSPILNATGHSRFSMYKGVLDAIVLGAAFWLGSRWGTVGIAAAWLIAYPVLVVPVYWYAIRSVGMAAGEYMRVLGPALCASCVMAAAMVALRALLPDTLTLTLRVLIEASACAAVYLTVIMTMRRDRMRTIVRFLRERSA